MAIYEDICRGLSVTRFGIGDLTRPSPRISVEPPRVSNFFEIPRPVARPETRKNAPSHSISTKTRKYVYSERPIPDRSRVDNDTPIA
jgi:hypothetical protein